MPRIAGGGGNKPGWGVNVPKDYPVSKDIEDRRDQGTLSKAWDWYVDKWKEMAKDTWESVTKKKD